MRRRPALPALRPALLAALPVAALLATACGGGSSDGGSAEPTSGATCPAGGTSLRYTGGGNGGSEPASFGATFFSTYCLGCHGATPSSGAPAHASFTTLAAIRDHAALIDQKAARGPVRTNTSMPPGGGPSDAERTNLGVWLACGAP